MNPRGVQLGIRAAILHRFRRLFAIPQIQDELLQLDARTQSLAARQETTLAHLLQKQKADETNAAQVAIQFGNLGHECQKYADIAREILARVNPPPDNQALQSRVAALTSELESVYRVANTAPHYAVRDVIRRSPPSNTFACSLNGVAMLIPRDTLRMMLHCVFVVPGGPLEVLVETAHLNWLRERLRPGDIFLDVGSATGAMALPIALGLGNHVVAFEPARTARAILETTIALNKTDKIEVVPKAISDQSGTVEFTELKFDDTELMNWQPEKSSIHTDKLDEQQISTRYPVETITLDQFLAGRADTQQMRCMKIDVEGFEVAVLRGAGQYLQSVRPNMTIDIHPDPFGTGDTEAGCRAILEPLGYSCTRLGHVLLASSSIH